MALGTYANTPESKIATPFCTREDYLSLHTRESFAHGKALHTGKTSLHTGS